MGHHALQLVAGQVVEAALGNGDHGIARGVAGRKGIDAGLLQNIDGGHRDPRGKCHLLNDVKQPLLPRVSGCAGDLFTTHHQGDGLAAGSEPSDLERASTADHKAYPRRREQEQLWLPPGHRRLGVIRAEHQQQPVHQRDQNQDRQDEIEHQLEGPASSRILLLKKIGGHGQRRLWGHGSGGMGRTERWRFRVRTISWVLRARSPRFRAAPPP